MHDIAIKYYKMGLYNDEQLAKFVKLKRTINPSNAQYLKVMNYIEHLESEGTD